MSKYKFDVEQQGIQLEVYECECGFHMGLDATYLEQVVGDKAKLSVECPSCSKMITTLVLSNVWEELDDGK